MSGGSYRIGIDVGGTFTKAALIDNATHEIVARSSVHTTHDHQQGVAAGVVQVLERIMEDAQVNPSEIALLAHSTTQATNALLEGDVARVGIVASASERTAKLAEQQAHVAPIELGPGRFLQTGNRFLVSDGIERSAIEEAVRELIAEGAQVLVASAAFGVDDTSTEDLVRTIGDDHNLPTTCGHEMTRLHGLTTRTRTAVVNASILPRMVATADMTESSVRKAGIDAPLMIMRGDGGVMDILQMRKRPAMTILSGPAAGVVGAAKESGISDGIFFEVGGTSTNICILKDRRPTIRHACVGGHATFIRSLDVRVLGIAGGSLIEIKDNDIRDIGPRSAHIAGLRYASFADARSFEHARVVQFRIKQGETTQYVAIETVDGDRFALTPTCAANALGLATQGMYCYARPTAARAAFLPLARRLGTDVNSLAAAVLEAAAAKIIPVIEALVREYELAEEQRILVGGGGGAGALLPFVADRMGLPFAISKDADIIASIGVALAMVHEVVERVIPNPSPDELANLRAEALEAAARLGADAETVTVSIEIDKHAGIVRAVATGSVALGTRGRHAHPSEPRTRSTKSDAVGATSFQAHADQQQTSQVFAANRNSEHPISDL